MNQLPTEKRAQIVAALVEGNSVRGTCRMTGVAKRTVLRLLVELGQACEDYQRRTLVNLPCRRIQCDEIWAFCYAKEKNLPEHLKGRPDVGDVYCWTALDSDSKLIVSWMVGQRNAWYGERFVRDIRRRLANRVQLTTDGLKVYLEAVERSFGADVDYAMLVKLYGPSPDSEKRYSPSECIGISKQPIMGWPDRNCISTSHVERQNLTMRMGMRRFTRLTNAFSKKLRNLEAAVALHFMHYNFVRIHSTLRVTPAMELGVTNRLWSIEDLVRLLDSK